MGVDEPQRHRLFRKLDQMLGAEEAGVFMSLVPPSGFDWDQSIESLRHEFRGAMDRLAKQVIMWTSTMMVALAGLAFAAGRLL